MFPSLQIFHWSILLHNNHLIGMSFCHFHVELKSFCRWTPWKQSHSDNKFMRLHAKSWWIKFVL
jgi:hypothetical protein